MDAVSTTTNQIRICNKCKIGKPLSSFYKKASNKDGLARNCKICGDNAAIAWKDNNRDKHNQNLRDWRKNNREKDRAYSRKAKIKSKYNLSIESYNNMLAQQNHSCAICGISQDDLKVNLFIDHNHNTGKVRQLLCNKCNSLLGYSLEREDILLKAIEYLRKHNKMEMI